MITAVDAVKGLLVDSYLAVDELITERSADKDGLVDFVIDINSGEVVTSMDTRSRRREEDGGEAD